MDTRSYILKKVNIFLLSASSLHRACHNALDNVFLADKIYDNDGYDIDHDTGHHGTHLHMAETSPEVLNRHGNGPVFLDIQNKRRQKVIVPYPHQLQDSGGDNGGLQNRDQHLRVHLKRTAAVDQRRLLDLHGDSFYKAGKHEYRQTCAEAQVNDTDIIGIIQLQ